MAPRYRSLHDPSVSSYLDDITTTPSQPLPSPAQAGAQAHDAALESAVASANKVKFSSPRAQSIARNVIGDTAREAEYQQRDRSRAQEQSARENERAQAAMAKAEADAAEANRAMNVRAGAAAGMKTETDIVTGKRSIATHPDGAPVYKAGPLGEPMEIGQQSSAVSVPGEEKPTTRPFVNPLIGDDGGAMGATGGTTQAAFAQPVRDDRGNVGMVQPDTTTDATTGRQYVSKTDPTTGATVKTAVGIDKAKYEQIQRDRQYQAKAQEIALRDNAIKQQRFRFDPAFKPVATEFEAATKEIEALPPVYTKQGGIWRYTDPKTLKEVTTYDPREVERQKTLRENAEKRHARAKEAYDKMAPNAGRLDSAEQQIREAKLKLESDKLRIDAGLPAEDGGAAEILAGSTAGIPSPLAETIRSATANAPITPEGGTEPMGPPVPILRPDTNEEAVRTAYGALRGIEGITARKETRRSQFDGKETSLTILERDGKPIATVSDGDFVPTTTLTRQGREDIDIREVANMAATGGAPLYLQQGRNRKSITEEATEVADIFSTVADPALYDETGKPSPALGKRLEEMKATPQAIMRRVDDGELSVQHGAAILKELYGMSMETTDPRDPEVFKAWVAEKTQAADQRLRDLYGKPTLTDRKSPGARLEDAGGTFKDFSAMDQVKRDFLVDQYQQNAGKPGVKRSDYVRMHRETNSKAGAPVLDIMGSWLNFAGKTAKNDVAGSMVGLASGIAVQGGAGMVAWTGDPEAKAKADEMMRLRNRSFANFTNGFARNMQKWGTAEGRETMKGFDQALSDFQRTIDEELDKPIEERDQNRIQSAKQGMSKAAKALHDLAPDEKWPMGDDDFDPDKDPVLMEALARYAATADPRVMGEFKARLLMNNGGRQLAAEMSKKVRSDGFWGAVEGGMYAGWQEIGTELLADAGMLVTAGGSKAVQASLKAAGAIGKAKRIERTGQAIGKALEKWETFGIRADSLANPLTRTQRAMNTGVRVAKTTMQAGAGEAGEEMIVEMGADDPDLAHAALMGAIGGIVLTPAFYPVQRAIRAGQERGAAQLVERENARFAKSYNDSQVGVDGFTPISPAMAATARNFIDQTGFEAKTRRLADAMAQITAMPESPAKMEMAEGIHELAQQFASESSLETERAIDAAREIDAAADPAEKTFLAGVAKVAVGNTAQLTQAERTALQRAATESGAPYFATVEGRDVLTDEARADIAGRSPALGALIQTTESQALLEAEAAAETITQPENASGAQGDPATGGSSVPPRVSDASGQGVQPSPEPTAAGAPNLAELDAAEYEMARAENPAMPEIRAAVADAVAQGRPVSVSMAKAAGIDIPEGYTRRGATLVPPVSSNSAPDATQATTGESAPETASKTKERAAKENTPQAIADRIQTTVETDVPGMKGRIAIVESSGIGATGGAFANPDGTVALSLDDIAREMQGRDPAAVEQSLLDIVLRHEIVHVVQYQAVQRMWVESGGKGDFPTFFREYYGRIAGEITPEAMATARDIYGAEAWDAQPVENQTAELVRMLVEARLNPDQSDRFSELSRQINFNESPNLIAHLKAAVDMLIQMVKTGKLPESARVHVEELAAMYEDLVGGNVKETAETFTSPEPNERKSTNPNLEKTRSRLGVEAETAPPTATSDGKSIESDTNAAETPMQSVGKAITRALAKYPAIGKDRASRDGLFDLTDELMEVTAPLTPAERAAYIDSAFEEYAQGLKEAAQEEAQAEDAGKSDTKRQKARNARMERESRIRDKARTILNSGNYSALSSVFERGRIQRKPNAIGLILARKRAGKKLTELEMGQLRNLSEWDGAPTKSEWKGGGNNEVIRAILDYLYAKPGEGLMPDQIASGLIPGVDTSSEMFEAIDKELRALSRGESLIDPRSPDYEGDAEAIAKADAAAQAALEAEETAQAPLPSLPDIIASLRETYGEDMDLAKKLDLAQQVIAQLPEPMQTAITQAAMEEEQRIAYGVISAAKWQEMNPGLSTPAKWFQRLLDNANTDSIRATLNKLRNPKVQEQFAAMTLASSPSARTEQDAAYLAAVEAGDMETAQTMADNAAESAGYRQVVAHQTHRTGIEIFDRTRGGKGVYEWDNIGIWTTGRSTPRLYGPVKIELYGRMENPKRYRDLDAYDKMVREYLSVAYPEAMFELRSDEIESDQFVDKFKQAIKKLAKKAKVGESAYSQKYQQWLTKKFPGAEGFRQYLKDQGHDGIQIDGAFWDGEIQTVRIYLEPNQVKSADPVTRDESGNVIPLSQRFNPQSDSILFSSPSTGFFDFGATGEMGDKSQMGLNFDGPRAKAKENAQAAFDKAPEGSPARARIATQIARTEGLADPAEFVKQAVKTATPETSSTEGSPAEAGYEYNPRNKYDGVLPETFRYTVANDIKIPEGSQVIASIIYERKIGRNHPLYRISIIENAEGGRYAMVEKGSDIQGGFGGALTSFERLDEYDDRQYAAVNDRARKLFEEHPKDQLGLFSSPSQRAFDFGTSGSFSTRNQGGFDFGDAANINRQEAGTDGTQEEKNNLPPTESQPSQRTKGNQGDVTQRQSDDLLVSQPDRNARESSGQSEDRKAQGEIQPQAYATDTSSAKRSKPKQLVTFAKPITGPSGAKLAAYEWKYRIEDTVDKRGEDAAVRVSNWEESQINDDTGREVVHQFYVETPDGKSQLVSLESALKILGYAPKDKAVSATVKSLASVVKTRAKNQMEADRLEAEIARINKALEEVRALPLPEVVKSDGPTMMRGMERVTIPWYSMGDAKGFPDYGYNGPKTGLLTKEWRDNRMKERGFPADSKRQQAALDDIKKRIAKADARIEQITSAAEKTAPAKQPEWVNFPASETLGIPRSEMPQVEAGNRSALVQFLKARGIDYAEAEILPGRLKPTQAEYSPAKVQKAREFEGGDRAILIDRNNRVVDGHHQWQAKLDKPAEPIRVICFNGRVQDLLPMIKEMPSTEVSGESANTQTPSDLPRAGTETVSPREAAAPAAPESPQTEQQQGEARDIGEDKKNVPPPTAPKPPAPGELVDFGEKMAGARKDQTPSAQKDITDSDIANSSLSQIWPKAEVDSIEDTDKAAIAHALRSEVPAKPRVSYKVKRWVDKVKLVRELMRFADEMGADALLERMDRPMSGLSDFANKIRLLQQVPREHWGRIDAVKNYPDAYRYESVEGQEIPNRIPAPYARTSVDGKGVMASSLDELAEKVNEAVAGGKKAPAMQFEVRQRRSGGDAWINKKGDPLKRRLKTFPDAKEALDYVKNNNSDLVAEWEKVKDSDNVKESDLRSKPNRPRAGADHRKGRDATPEMFEEAFGFRGVEFGNWVSQGKNAKERQGMLNGAYDALFDLASIMKVPTKALSLNGTLGLAFGSRGSGSASAHYEPDNLVINLTKTRGAGTLAHEWFHGLDHYFQRKRNASGIKGNAGDYLTQNPENYYQAPDGTRLTETRFNELKERNRISRPENWKLVEGVRPQVAEAFADLVKALNDSPMKKRASLIDKGKSDGYWSRIIELAARSFESYTVAKMQQQGYHNDYLTNFAGVDEYGRDPGRYPYLLEEELAPVEEAFDNLFAVLETKETDKGIALYSSPSRPQQPDLFTAASAPDAAQKLGDVKVGRMNALGAYRALTAKRAAGKPLTAQEEQQLLDAEVALGQKLAFDMEALRGQAPPVDKESLTTATPPPEALGGSLGGQSEMMMGGETERGGQMRLFSSATVNLLKSDFATYPNPDNYETYDERRATILEIARDNGNLELVRPIDQDSSSERRFQEATGVSIVYFRGGEGNSGGFVAGIAPDVIFVNTEQTRYPTSWILAHELVHSSQKDARFPASRLYRETLELLNPYERSAIIQTLRQAKYEREEMRTEVTAHLVADAIMGEEAFDFSVLEKSAELRNYLESWFMDMPVLKPESFPDVEDGDLSLLSSPSPTPEDMDAIEQALSKMRPIYRRVFEAVNSGMTPEQVMAKFSLSEKAVANILDAVRSRVVIATRAAAGTLNAEVNKDGKFVNNRPDLAEGGKEPFAAVDQIRNESGVKPGERGYNTEERRQLAIRALNADYEGNFARLEDMARDGVMPEDLDVFMAQEIFEQEVISGRINDPARATRVALFRVAYRDEGTQQSDAFRARIDRKMNPAQRNAVSYMELLYEPSPEVQARMKKAKGDKPTQEAILRQWMDRVNAFKAEMKAEGYDIDASLKAFAEKESARKQAEQDNARTKAAVDQAFRKLPKIEKTVIETIRSGALLDVVERITGLPAEQILEINARFNADIREAIKDSIRSFMSASLASSPTNVDMVTQILAEFGVWSNDMIDNRKKDFKDRRSEVLNPKPAKPEKPAKPRKTKAEELLGVPERELTDKQKAAIERFVNAPPSTWKAIRQETAKLFPESEGFPESYEDGENARRILGGMLFPEPINETTGTFNMADPAPMAYLANEWASRNGSWINKLTEFYKMAILSGAQTMLVNASGGLFLAHDLTTRRAVEAAWNDLLGMFGQNDVRSATLSEFLPMLKQVRAGMKLAAKNALRSWRLQSPVFESYAEAKPIQTDFLGTGAEFAPPALETRSPAQFMANPKAKDINKMLNWFLRAITFRELTMVDEFWKSMYGQINTAGIAHRIAAKEEKLSGKAYAERVEELMQPGSQAWMRTISGAKRVTFQDELAYGKFTKEDERKNPAHKAGRAMTWEQALKKSETQSAWTLLDAVAAKAMEARKTPFLGPLLHMFALPFIVTPKNIIQRGLEITPLGAVVDLIDGMRSLRRRMHSGQITKEESNRIAGELYNKARFVQTLTNQSLGLMIYFAAEALSDDDEEDEYGRPIITGTLPWSATKKGERDTAMAVMPPQSIRIGDTIIPYGRIEPFATAISALVDMAVSSRRNGDSFNSQVLTDTVVGFKSQFQDKLFLKGLGDILRLFEEGKGADRLAASWITGFVPNLVRQPIRELDPVVRDKNPQANDGILTAIGKRVGYELVPKSAPPKMSVWGEEIASAPGAPLAGSEIADGIFRVLDPLNVRFGTEVKPIDAWIFRYNHMQPLSNDRIGIEVPDDEITITIPGEKPRKIALTEEEKAQRIRNVGKAAEAFLTQLDWDVKTATAPDAGQKAKLIKDTFTRLKAEETERLKFEKIAAGLPPVEE